VNMTNKRTTKQKKLSYSDIEEIVEYLVKTKSRTYSFDCYTEEDIGQEIRIICLKKLDDFDSSRVKEDKIQNFFGRCVDNALKNLKRDNYLRTSPPCRGDCDALHGDQFINETGLVCKKWLRFRNNLQRKIKVKHPIPIEVIGDNVKDSNHQEEIESRDLEKHVLESVPEELKDYLILMMDGKGKQVPRKEKKRIQIFIKRILD
jgi:hypothetical protein